MRKAAQAASNDQTPETDVAHALANVYCGHIEAVENSVLRRQRQHLSAVVLVLCCIASVYRFVLQACAKLIVVI